MGWLHEEFARARERRAKVPAYARPQYVEGRRLVEWRINVYEPDCYEVIREENGKVHRIGGATRWQDAEGILRCDRIRVLHDPQAVEVRPPQHCVR